MSQVFRLGNNLSSYKLNSYILQWLHWYYIYTNNIATFALTKLLFILKCYNNNVIIGMIIKSLFLCKSTCLQAGNIQFTMVQRFQLFINCKHISQALHSLLPMRSNQWWVSGGRKFWKSGYSCLHTVWWVCCIFLGEMTLLPPWQRRLCFW